MASMYVKYKHRLINMTAKDMAIHTMIMMLNILIEFISSRVFLTL